ncbi:hypothetical protein ANO11243_032220 [Dothideomycetidae sp. 11243]|nr:hypothetical protein ANO11243_032220 [fungal sp. No.11243]
MAKFLSLDQQERNVKCWPACKAQTAPTNKAPRAYCSLQSITREAANHTRYARQPTQSSSFCLLSGLWLRRIKCNGMTVPNAGKRLGCMMLARFLGGLSQLKSVAWTGLDWTMSSNPDSGVCALVASPQAAAVNLLGRGPGRSADAVPMAHGAVLMPPLMASSWCAALLHTSAALPSFRRAPSTRLRNERWLRLWRWRRRWRIAKKESLASWLVIIVLLDTSVRRD